MKPIILPYNGIYPRIDEGVFIAPGAVVIGDVEIGSGSSIWFGCVLRGDVHHIRIGKNTNIQDGTVVHVSQGTHSVNIGNDILIGHSALIHGCTLMDGCFIGMRATVIDGAVVETSAMVAAGALVTPNKRVPGGELWGGSPAKKLRDLRDEEIAGFPESVAHYKKVAADYLRAGFGKPE